MSRSEDLMSNHEWKPGMIWFNGKLHPWEDATVHVWSEVAVRGTSLFEGLRAYWQEGAGRYAVLALDEHMRRLEQSCRLLRVPAEPHHFSELREGMFELLSALRLGNHAYVRPTIFINSGRYGYRREDVEIGTYITCFPVDRPVDSAQGKRLKVSSWQRLSDLAMSPLIKTGGAYQSFRLPLIEAREAGFDDAVLLNSDGTVAETTGATLFLVRNGCVVTPDVTAGILESITRRKTIELLRDEFGIETVERKVLRNELYLADEIFLTGTLAEIQSVIDVDGLAVGSGAGGSLTSDLRKRFASYCIDATTAPSGWFTFGDSVVGSA